MTKPRRVKLKGWMCWNPRAMKLVTIYRDQMRECKKLGMRVVPVEIKEIRDTDKR